jgi:CBS domain-containing protein
MKVKEIMKKPYVVDKDITFYEAAKLMSSKEIGSLVFVVKNKVRGIVTHTDLINNYNSNGKISSILQSKVITADADEDIDSALELMRKNKIHHLPVLDGENLVGVITSTDIAAHADELEEEFFFN